jgi:iron complex transport system permease protein
MNRQFRRPLWLVALLALALLAPLLLALAGTPAISPTRLLNPAFAASADGRIFWQLRLPRVALGFLAGAALAIGGMVFQAVFRNPLATPFTLGVSTGASFGAAVAVRLGLAAGLFGFSSVSLFAFLGAAVTVGIIYLLASVKKEFSAEVMLLAGVALSFLFSSAILLIQYLSDFTGSYQMVRWLMGDLNAVGFGRPLQLAAVLLPGALVVRWLCLDLNLILVGDDFARSRGVDVRRVRLVLFGVVSLLTGVVVSFCGPIGFIGMMVPHILRLLLGAEHRWLFWGSLLGGGVFLACCDFVARALIFPAEVPVGIITTLLGGPFFLWLLIRGRSNRYFL